METLGESCARNCWSYTHFLADGMGDAEDFNEAEDWPDQGRGMEDGADVGHGKKVGDLVLTGFNIDLDFRKGGHIGKCLAVARIFILGGCDKKPCPASAAMSILGELVHVVGGASWPSYFPPR